MIEKLGSHAISINEDGIKIKAALGIDTLSVRFRDYPFLDRVLHRVSSRRWKLPIAIANTRGRITLFRGCFSRFIQDGNHEKVARILAHESHHLQEFAKRDPSKLGELLQKAKLLIWFIFYPLRNVIDYGKDEEKAAKESENAWQDFLPYFHIYSEEDLLRES